MTEIFNQEWSIEYRRELRDKPTKAERRLWGYLCGRQVFNTIFRRQYNIGRYITDFYVPSLRLVIEVDGQYHNLPEVIVYDRDRTAYFTTLGLMTVRFTNDEVFADIDCVIKRLTQIVVSLREHPL